MIEAQGNNRNELWLHKGVEPLEALFEKMLHVIDATTFRMPTSVDNMPPPPPTSHQ